MGTFAISPRFTNEKLSAGRLEDKIDVFEDQMRGWIFDHARALLSPDFPGSRHSGLAVFMLACSYFEAFAEFFEGKSSKGHSAEYFGIGFQRVFPQLRAMAEHLDATSPRDVVKNVIGVFYGQLRCGFFHEAMFGNKVVIDPGAGGLGPIYIVVNVETHDVASITLNPAFFLEAAERAFGAYVTGLRDETNAIDRQNFEQFWDLRATEPGAIIPQLDEVHIVPERGRAE